MKNRRNYYRILHVQSDAPEAIIKASYRALMQKLKLHPDLGGDEWNATVLNEAYAVLSNPERRSAYDKTIARDKTTQRVDPRKTTQTQASKGPRHPESPCPGPRCPFCSTAIPVYGVKSPAADCPDCASPLQPVAHLRLEAASQRAVARMPRSAPLTFFTIENQKKGYAAILQDLSINGLQFLSNCKLLTQQIIRIDSDVLSATARITHSRKHSDRKRYLTGVEFVTLRFHALQGTFVSEKA